MNKNEGNRKIQALIFSVIIICIFFLQVPLPFYNKGWVYWMFPTPWLNLFLQLLITDIFVWTIFTQL